MVYNMSCFLLWYIVHVLIHQCSRDSEAVAYHTDIEKDQPEGLVSMDTYSFTQRPKGGHRVWGLCGWEPC